MSGYVVLKNGEQPEWLHFDDPVDIISTTRLAEVARTLRQVERAVARYGLYAAGFLAYEAAPAFDPAFQVRQPAALPLLWFGLYRRLEIEPLTRDDRHTYQLGDWQATINRSDYEQAISAIKSHIACGDTYQVNYTIRLRSHFSGEPWTLFCDLAHAQGGPYAAFVDTGTWAICSASPELFFSRAGEVLMTKPMKGTASRGRTPAADDRQVARLQNSQKDRAENLMIVDMIRNDLSRFAQLGSVRVPHLFQVEHYPTVLQMTSTIIARSQRPVSEIMAALFPCASITGAPKVRTMQIIAELETEPRGIYTGCIGFISPHNLAQFNVAIRTVAINKASGLAEYGVGSGIVWDSESGQEYEECQTKAQILTSRFTC